MAKLIENENTKKLEYSAKVIELIRLKYSQNEENAILRKKLANIDTNDEFTAYNAYVEECKANAKSLLGVGSTLA